MPLFSPEGTTVTLLQQWCISCNSDHFQIDLNTFSCVVRMTCVLCLHGSFKCWTRVSFTLLAVTPSGFCVTSCRWWKRICHLSFGIPVFCWANWDGQSTNYAEHEGNWYMLLYVLKIKAICFWWHIQLLASGVKTRAGTLICLNMCVYIQPFSNILM